MRLRDNIISIIVVIGVAIVGSIVLATYNQILTSRSTDVTDATFDVNTNFPNPLPVIVERSHSGSILLYNHFIMAGPITPDAIRKSSYRIQVDGKLQSAELHVEASPTSFGTDKTRIHTVYFYIDDGNTGGHLASRRENAQIVEGGFRIGDPPYVLNLNMDTISVAKGVDEKINIHPLATLNDGQPHWVGAFVSTGIYGSLDYLEIRYTCEQGSQCNIHLVQ